MVELNEKRERERYKIDWIDLRRKKQILKQEKQNLRFDVGDEFGGFAAQLADVMPPSATVMLLKYPER